MYTNYCYDNDFTEYTVYEQDHCFTSDMSSSQDCSNSFTNDNCHKWSSWNCYPPCQRECKRISTDILCSDNCNQKIDVQSNLFINGRLVMENCPIHTNRLAALKECEKIHICSPAQFKNNVEICGNLHVEGETKLGPTTAFSLDICPGTLKVGELSGCTGASITLSSTIIGGSAEFANYSLTNQSLGSGTSLLGPQTGPGGNVRDFKSLSGTGSVAITNDAENITISVTPVTNVNVGGGTGVVAGPILSGSSNTREFRTFTTSTFSNLSINTIGQNVILDYSLSPHFISLQSATQQIIPNAQLTRLVVGNLAGGGNGFIYPGVLGNNMCFATNFGQNVHLKIVSSVYFLPNPVGIRTILISRAPANDPTNPVFIQSNSLPAQPELGTMVQTSFVEETGDAVFYIDVYQNSGGPLPIVSTGPTDNRTNVLFKAYYQGLVN